MLIELHNKRKVEQLRVTIHKEWESRAQTRAKLAVKVAQATHWENKAIDKEEKLNRAVREMKECTSMLDKVKEARIQVRLVLDQSRHDLD